MAEENAITVDEEAFFQEQERAKNLSRQARGGTAGGEVVALDVHDIAELEKNADVPKTDDSFKYCKLPSAILFMVRGRLGLNCCVHYINVLIYCLSPVYQVLGTTNAHVKAIYHAHKFSTTTANVSERKSIGLILDRTNFYAEQGGQEYDTGNLVTVDGSAEFVVENTQVYAGYVLHVGYLKYGEVKIEDEVVCSYDEVGPFSIVD